jgi:Fe-S-cluster containining protein
LPDDCTTCGTCCFSLLEDYVAVTGDDHARLGDAAEANVVFHGNKAYMRMALGRCGALVLEGGRFLCGVYVDRPDTCRDLARDGAACGGEIATKGERPLIALRNRRDASARPPS